ncbi:hypothetical protein NGRA_3053 [Nosema granulosis]|uniref:Uncharacterized protein n=1 Tax=Nosema granulosis TaxID=83296 RepID=A0A9P6GVI0_9MICR|nr:hypothetical protein NGRA_3053 [Nosema granulosis]
MRIVYGFYIFISRVLTGPAFKIYMTGVYEEKLSRHCTRFLYEGNNLNLAEMSIPNEQCSSGEKDLFRIDKRENIIYSMFKYDFLKKVNSPSAHNINGSYQMEQVFDLDFRNGTAQYRIVTEFRYLSGTDKKFKLKTKVVRADLNIDGVHIIFENNEVRFNAINDDSTRFIDLFNFLFKDKFKDIRVAIISMASESYYYFSDDQLLKAIANRINGFCEKESIDLEITPKDNDCKLFLALLKHVRDCSERRQNSAFDQILYLMKKDEGTTKMFHCVCIDIDIDVNRVPNYGVETTIEDIKDLTIHFSDVTGKERKYGKESYFVFGNKICIKMEHLLLYETVELNIISKKRQILEVPVREFLVDYLAAC